MSKVREVLVVAADPRELAGLLQRCTRVVGLKWELQAAFQGETEGRRWTLVANGPGTTLAQQAATLALRQKRFDSVVSTGFCGALDPSLPIAALIAADQVGEPVKGGLWQARLPQASCYRGRIACVDYVVQTAAERERLWHSGWRAVEMEAAAVAAASEQTRSAFYCIRSVTDLGDESLQADFNAARGEDGRFRTLHLVRQAFRRPGTVGRELWRLKGRSERAAQALGEFLVTCDL